MRCWRLCSAEPTLKFSSSGGFCRSGSYRHRVEDTLQVVDSEGLFNKRWRAVLLSLIDVKFMAGQGDRRDSVRRAMPAQRPALAVALYQIRHQDIDLPDRQERGRLGAILTRGHIVAEIRQDSRDEFANSSIRFRQQDLRHWPL